MPKKRRRKRRNWFSLLFGFDENAQTYKEIQQLLVVDGNTLASKRNSKSYKLGHFATESLGEQRARVMENEKVPQLVGQAHGLVLKIAIGDVTKFLMKPSNRHATFQVCYFPGMHKKCLCKVTEAQVRHMHACAIYPGICHTCYSPTIAWHF